MSKAFINIRIKKSDLIRNGGAIICTESENNLGYPTRDLSSIISIAMSQTASIVNPRFLTLFLIKESAALPINEPSSSTTREE
jgi:hypothetical protein